MGHHPAPSPAGLSGAFPEFYYFVFLFAPHIPDHRSTFLLLFIYYLRVLQFHPVNKMHPFDS